MATATATKFRVLALLIYLSACSSPKCAWQKTPLEIEGSIRLVHQIGDDCFFEVYDFGNESVAFLSFPTPPIPPIEQKISFTYTLDHVTYPCFAPLLSGGQKALIPREASSAILMALFSKKKVTFHIGGVEGELEPVL